MCDHPQLFYQVFRPSPLFEIEVFECKARYSWPSMDVRLIIIGIRHLMKVEEAVLLWECPMSTNTSRNGGWASAHLGMPSRFRRCRAQRSGTTPGYAG